MDKNVEQIFNMLSNVNGLLLHTYYTVECNEIVDRANQGPALPCLHVYNDVTAKRVHPS